MILKSSFVIFLNYHSKTHKQYLIYYCYFLILSNLIFNLEMLIFPIIIKDFYMINFDKNLIFKYLKI